MKGLGRFLCVLSAVICLNSCSPSSSEDFQREGQGLSRSIIKEIESVKTVKDLSERGHRLEDLFERLVDVMIAADENLSQDEINEEYRSKFDVSVALKAELERVYLIAGCSDLIEKYQEPALHRLDAYVQKKERKRMSRLNTTAL